MAPAAHYLIGGILSVLHGRTTPAGLYAVGECASTGVHGANRLASNSLTECFVFGARAAQAAVTEPHVARRSPVPDWRFTPPNAQTREAMWRLAGPRRRAAEVEQLLDDPYPLARLIARAALSRHESRGAHQCSDFPHRDPHSTAFTSWSRATTGCARKTGPNCSGLSPTCTFGSHLPDGHRRSSTGESAG